MFLKLNGICLYKKQRTRWVPEQHCCVWACCISNCPSRRYPLDASTPYIFVVFINNLPRWKRKCHNWLLYKAIESHFLWCRYAAIQSRCVFLKIVVQLLITDSSMVSQQSHRGNSFSKKPCVIFNFLLDNRLSRSARFRRGGHLVQASRRQCVQESD